jgi:hypothetical protein
MSQGFDSAKPKFLDPLVSAPMRQNFVALATHHAGAVAPTDPQEGWFWLDTSDSTNVKVKLFHSNAWITILANVQAGPPSQSNVDKYVHTQGTSVTTWNITHTLSTDDLIVMVYDASGNWILPNEIILVDDDNVQITFLAAQSGKAVLTG